MSAAVYSIEGGDFEHGGSASRSLKEQLKKIGAEPAVVRRAMIAAYEAEMNVVIHSHGGELRATLDDGQLDVEVSDRGPGIADIEKAMKEGFSTASAQARELGFGAGMGLPNIKKNSDRFAIESAVGQGTKVSFSIRLKPQALYGASQHSIEVSGDACVGCFRCVHACPTRAMRVFRGKPQVLDYLCVDCAACLASCPQDAFRVQGTAAELKPSPDVTLVVSPASLTQHGTEAPPARVFEELGRLGFGEVRCSAGWDDALRTASIEHARHNPRVRPIIAPMCNAVLSLIEMRFPALIRHVAPLLSPLEAMQAELPGRRLAFTVTCPCQRTALLGQGEPPPEFVLPAALRAALAPRLCSEHATPAGPGTTHARPAWPDAVLQISGAQHVLSLMEQIENGLAADLEVVEPYMCDEAGFGSPLLGGSAAISRWRWESAPLPADPAAKAVPRSKPLAPRPGLRLDSDMSKAIQKLARIDKLTRSLPGGDCALCGAPSCASLAEDIVLGRVEPDSCVRQKPAGDGPPQTEKTP